MIIGNCRVLAAVVAAFLLVGPAARSGSTAGPGPAEVPWEVAGADFSEAVIAQRTKDIAVAIEKRRPRYQLVKARAVGWLDGLEVDPIDLLAHEVSGVKKLAEILLSYQILWRAEQDDGKREMILKRARQLTEVTGRAEYHAAVEKGNYETYEAYLKVLLLMEEFGLETADYRKRLRALQPALDALVTPRRHWEAALFAEYYERFDLEKPAALRVSADELPPLAERMPWRKMNMMMAYDLSHEVFVAYAYGLRRNPEHLSPDDVRYLFRLLPRGLKLSLRNTTTDIAAEQLSNLTHLGWAWQDIYPQAIDYLLSNQNPNGSWGHYEEFREAEGPYLDHQYYLHTTGVALNALVEVFEGKWPVAKRVP